MNLRTDSYCGLYCGACHILDLYKRSLGTNVPARWQDLPGQLKENIPQGELKCEGCKSDVLFVGCQNCSVRICAREKHIEACIECAEFPCREVQGRMEYLSKNLRETLPHTRVAFRNLLLIKEKGLAAWLSDQEKKWSCPQCSEPFMWYQEKCEKCGRDLQGDKDFNKY